MISLIVAMTKDGVIGLHGKIPWHYPADMKRFKRLTEGNHIIMGRLTWESLPKKPLPNRHNIVVCSAERAPAIELAGASTSTVRSIDEALALYRTVRTAATSHAWFIGGARIYDEAFDEVDEIDMTIVPDLIDPMQPGVAKFPFHAPRPRASWLDAGTDFEIVEDGPLEDDPRLRHIQMLRER